MNIKEMQAKLQTYCSSENCRECALGSPEFDCSDILYTDELRMSPTVIKMLDMAYSIVFQDGVKQSDTPHIKDSGERREFVTGAVRDMSAGKGRMDLLPWAAIMEVSKHCENGCNKYGEHNVDKGIPTHSLCDSAGRHLAKYLDGWEDEPHLLAAAWNLLWAIQMELKNPDMVDTPYCKYKEKYNAEKN